MRIAVITTSRADYGIYESLLNQLANAADVDYGLLVGGTHLSEKYGYTIREIESDGHPIWAKIQTVPNNDRPLDIANACGSSIKGYAEAYTQVGPLDYVVALGDRYEMFGAVAATVPFNLKVVHLHGGETTAGAIDDKFRHAISVMASLHFTATEEYGRKVAKLTGGDSGVFVVGSIAMDSLHATPLLTVSEMREKFGIDFTKNTILVTLHPETVEYHKNAMYADVLCEALEKLADRYQIVITLPNADTAGNSIREIFFRVAERNKSMRLVESFGKAGYFAAMHHSRLLIGNTSSGLLEAPSFGKYAINLGNRQAGRTRSANVIDVAFDADAIISAVAEIEKQKYQYTGENVYVKFDNAGRQIMEALRAEYAFTNN